MAEVPFDVVEQILVRLDVKELLRYKSVCKSWQSLISSPRFVQAHLIHAYNNDRNNSDLGHRRIGMGMCVKERNWLYFNSLRVVGSCNGLVCVSPIDVEFLVINPSTREDKKLPTPPYRPDMSKLSMIRQVVCWGFGYDSAADDYKVVVGFRRSFWEHLTHFYVLTLKSNIWKLIGQVNYLCMKGIDGMLCGGALHWFMTDGEKKVIVTLDLSTDEFKEIPQPRVECDKPRLGVLDECLCIYSSRFSLSSKKWVMKNNKWELYNGHCESKYDVAHCVVESRNKKEPCVYRHDDGKRVPSVGDYTRASIFVKSLVSPHPQVVNGNEEQKRKVKQQWWKWQEGIASGNIRKRKTNTWRRRRRRKRSGS